MRRALLYVEVVLLTVAVMVVTLDLGRADLRVPIDYSAGGGRHFVSRPFQDDRRHRLVYGEPLARPPEAMKLYDFPMTDTLPMVGVKLLILLTGDPFLSANLYFLLTFPVVAAVALCVLRAGRRGDRCRWPGPCCSRSCRIICGMGRATRTSRPTRSSRSRRWSRSGSASAPRCCSGPVSRAGRRGVVRGEGRSPSLRPAC